MHWDLTKVHYFQSSLKLINHNEILDESTGRLDKQLLRPLTSPHWALYKARDIEQRVDPPQPKIPTPGYLMHWFLQKSSELTTRRTVLAQGDAKNEQNLGTFLSEAGQSPMSKTSRGLVANSGMVHRLRNNGDDRSDAYDASDGALQLDFDPSNGSHFLHASQADPVNLSALCGNLLHNINNSDAFMKLNCSVNTSELSEAPTMYKHPVLGGLLSFFAIVTILGNLLVIAAVARERYLRTVTNYFIVSLALADLIIGAVVMPFSIFLEITNNVWIFGSDWCDVWHSIDVLASTASILNLSVISLDRYWAITDPIAYPTKMSSARSCVLMALVWICSAAISFPAIIWWRSVLPDPAIPNVCSFTEDSAYLIFSSFISFYFPISVILFAYYKIYKAATAQTRSLKTGTKVMTTDGQNGEVMTLRMHRGGVSRDAPDTLHYARAANSDDSDESPTHLAQRHLASGVRPSRMISRKWKHFAISKKLSKLAKEQKAAKTLGIVMGVFCICWVPFFFANVLFGICNVNCVKHAEIVFPVFTWLGYINSGMNPVIYACSMRDFRRAFIKIMCCFCPGYIRFRARKRYIDTNYNMSTSSCAVNYTGERSNSKGRL